LKYLIAGALAISWHGYPPYSADVDLLVRPTPEKAQLVLNGQLGYEPNRIDLMTSISGVTFDEAWQTRVQGQIDGLTVVLIGRAALLRNREATGRGKDKIDAEELRKQQRPKT
jgi:hypothetical protein